VAPPVRFCFRALNLYSHRVQGLATFNAEGFNGLVAVDYKSGALQPLLLADFGSILQFCGAFSRNTTFVASAYPSPLLPHCVFVTI
jgi:hypothetical protein